MALRMLRDLQLAFRTRFTKEEKNMWSIGPYALFDRRGALLCHAVGCKARTKLVLAHRGLFCPPHQKALSHLRSHLAFAKQDDVLMELHYRSVGHE